MKRIITLFFILAVALGAQPEQMYSVKVPQVYNYSTGKPQYIDRYINPTAAGFFGFGNDKVPTYLGLGSSLSIVNGQIVVAGGGGLPDQTGQAGKFLTTNGTAASWGNATTTPPGVNGQWVYNNNGVFGAFSTAPGIREFVEGGTFSLLNSALTGDQVAGLATNQTFTGNETFAGIFTLTGQSVRDQTTMSGTVMDVTKPVRQKGLSGSETWTFSNATPTTGTTFTIDVSADGTDRPVTLPANIYSYDTGAVIAAPITVPANVSREWIFVKESARWTVRGTGVATTGTGAYVLANNATIGAITSSQAVAAATVTPSVTVVNTNVATLNNQMYSPSIVQQGAGWGTTGSASQTVAFRQYVQPVQGTTPVGNLIWGASINAAAYTDMAGVNSAGLIQSFTNASTAGFEFAASGRLSVLNRARLKSPVDSVWTMYNAAESAFAQLNFGGTTSSFAALNVNGTTITAGLANATGALTAGGAFVASGTFRATAATGGIGYGTGAGGTVTQATNRTTGVTLNTVAGAITTSTASLASNTSATFTVTNSTVAITDTIVLSIRSGQTNKETHIYVTAVAAGSFDITVHNLNGVTAEVGAIIVNFAVIKAVTS